MENLLIMNNDGTLDYIRSAQVVGNQIVGKIADTRTYIPILTWCGTIPVAFTISVEFDKTRIIEQKEFNETFKFITFKKEVNGDVVKNLIVPNECLVE